MTFLDKNATLKNGYNCYINSEIDDMGSLMDVGLLVLDEGEVFELCEREKETAIILFEGAVDFVWGENSLFAERESTFKNGGYCLHVSCGEKVKITAKAHSELYVQKTINKNAFEAVMYTPDTVHVQRAGANGELMGCMRRDIKTYFDHDNAPYSNMVLGEVLSHPGKWSSYPPHFHPQPEVYFYRFDYPDGFGAGFANDEIYKTVHNGLAVITSNFHSQVTAPGYALCYAWGIRHLDGDPWLKTRIDNPEHSWLWEADANEHIFKAD